MIVNILLALLIFSSCSTPKVKNPSADDVQKVSKESFKKEKLLSLGDVKDFIAEKPKTSNSALYDETLDRYSVEELSLLSDSKDPLLNISIYCTKGDFNKAFDLASKLFDRYQKIPSYWNQIGNCHLNQGSHRKALLFYNKALEVNPGYVPSLNNMGVSYARQGEDQKALIAFERANTQSRFSKTPRYNLAKLFLKYGLAESALPFFNGLLNDSPKDADLLNAVASCYFMMSDYQTANSFFSRLPQDLLSRAEYGLNFSITLKKLNKLDLAKKIYSRIIEPKSKEQKDYYSLVGSQLGVQ
jgi:tetratricopeptide (TPR) repeat protein